jgi:hypothetical protein
VVIEGVENTDMKRGLLSGFLGTAALALLTASPAYALPTLQLDIAGPDVYYDTTTETVMTTSDTFSLYAYLSFNGTNGDGGGTTTSPADLIADTYYVSIALTPKTSVGADLGSIVFGGTTIAVTGDMVYGTPPIESSNLFDPQDLAKHGIYDTYYYEYAFKFDPTAQVVPYNTQNTDGSGPTFDSSLGDYNYMLAQAFAVDMSGLADGYELHFDLYSTDVVTKCATHHHNTVCHDDTVIDQFAPFSHDAGTGTGGQVPEPGSIVLMGAGLLGLALWDRRRGRARE